MYFVFRFTRFEQMPGTKIDHLGVPVFNVSTVLTRIEKVSGNKIDSLQVPTFNVSIVFHTL